MTRLSVADNSGAKELQVIGHVRKREPAVLGDVVRCVVKAASPDAKVSRKEIVAAVIVRTKGIHRRRDGTTVYADRGRERNDTRKLAPDPPTPTRPALLPVPTPPPLNLPQNSPTIKFTIKTPDIIKTIPRIV